MTLALGPALSGGTNGTETGIQTFVVAKSSHHVVFQWSEYCFDAVVALALFKFFGCKARALLRSWLALAVDSNSRSRALP